MFIVQEYSPKSWMLLGATLNVREAELRENDQEKYCNYTWFHPARHQSQEFLERDEWRCAMSVLSPAPAAIHLIKSEIAAAQWLRRLAKPVTAVATTTLLSGAHESKNVGIYAPRLLNCIVKCFL